MIRGGYPAPVVETPPEPEAVPKSVDLMNMGTGQSSGTSTGESRGIDDLLGALRRSAQDDEGGIFGT